MLDIRLPHLCPKLSRGSKFEQKLDYFIMALLWSEEKGSGACLEKQRHVHSFITTHTSAEYCCLWCTK